MAKALRAERQTDVTLPKQLENLHTKESCFLGLAAEEGCPKDKVRVKMTTIRHEQTRSLEVFKPPRAS